MGLLFNTGQVDQLFRGVYLDGTALATAFPTDSDGAFAIVKSTDTIWIWDSDLNQWYDSGSGGGSVVSVNGQSGVVALTEDDIPTGTTFKKFKSVSSGTNISVDNTDPTAPVINTTDTVAFDRVTVTGNDDGNAEVHIIDGANADIKLEKTGTNAGTFQIYNDGFANIVGPGVGPNRRFAFYDQMGAGSGTEALPPFTNFGDTDTGMYFPGANQIGFSTAGTKRVGISGQGIDIADGTEATPTIANTGDTDTGIFFPSDNAVGVTAGGLKRLEVNANNVTATADVVIQSDGSTKRLILDADNNIPRIMSFRTDNSPRWALRVDGNETGSNEGADFAIRRYNDAGTFIDAPISIDRSTGDITTSQDFTAGGNVSGANFSPTFLSETNQITGFNNNTGITVTYSHTNRTVTLTGTIEYYWKGIKKTLSSGWVSSAHTATNGGWFLYSSDGDNFVWSQTPWDFGYVMVAYVWYQPTAAQSFALREPHGLMDYKSHEEFHQAFGTYRRSGGALTAGTYTENTASNAATTPGFDSAVVKDEDIETTVPAWTEGSYTQMYVGASSTATFVKGASYPFTETGSYLQVNNPTTGAMTNGTTGNYYNVYQILLPAAADSDSQSFRMVMLQPQATFASLAAAQAEDIRTLQLGSFTNLATEWVIYARITYVTAAGDANAGKCRIATGGVTYVTGTRAGIGTISGYSPTDHSGLTNLTWSTSGHTATATRIAGFADTTGAAAEITTGTGLSLSSNTLSVTETPALKSATTTVNVSSATAPSSGQVLTAISSTAATWQTPATPTLSWGSSVNGNSGTGLSLSIDNSAAVSTKALSLSAGNTQSSPLSLQYIYSGTSNASVTNIQSYIATTGSSSFSKALDITVDDAGAGYNKLALFTNNETDSNGGLDIIQNGVGGRALRVYGSNNVNSSSTGLVNFAISNTQSGASLIQRIDLGTSAQGHIGLDIKMHGDSTSQRGITIDTSSTGTGIPIQFVTLGTGRTLLDIASGFTTSTAPAGASSYINVNIGGVAYRILAQAVS